MVNVSSGGGSFGERIGPVAYAASKAALNALTVKVAQAVRATSRPTRCARMGPHRHGRFRRIPLPKQAADTLMWLATLPADGPNGGFFRDRKPIPW